MQSSLESRLPRRARVQLLNSDNGGFLAMARRDAAGHAAHSMVLAVVCRRPRAVRFSSPHSKQIRRPPRSSPISNGHLDLASKADGWLEFKMLLTARYDFASSGREDFVAWMLYVRRARTGCS
jgi:hypothetical protein